jgi:hypothetical protein
VTQLPAELPYEDWREYLFGSPVGPSGFRESDDWWDEQAAPDLAVEHLTRLFESADTLPRQYPHDQIDRGLWFLAGESGHLRPLLEPPVPWARRRRGLLAIGNLYSGLLARVCTNHLGHLDRGPEPPDPLNAICYMWWDLFPTWGGERDTRAEMVMRPGRPSPSARSGRGRQAGVGGETACPTSVGGVLLQVMERTLRLESEPCREGALHGLGHWRAAHPERVTAIVDAWLGEEPAISSELRQYAMSARSGCVL